jgi:hypothetical protein
MATNPKIDTNDPARERPHQRRVEVLEAASRHLSNSGSSS